MKKKSLIFFSIFLILFIAACGNLSKNSQTPSKTEPMEESEKEYSSNNDVTENGDKVNPSEDTTSSDKIVTLYFSDSEAMYLVGEERTVSEITPEILINELIKGPKNPENNRTIPDGTKLLDVKVEDKIAYVNFSKELKDNHWGGSTGEIHTVFSVVNTLALCNELDIEEVQILIEGQTVETLAGHIELGEPFKPDLALSKLQ